jgi:putative ABC transport system permease protein
MSMAALMGVLQLGLLYAVPALAVAFSFRVAGFPDLTPDGAFTFGAAIGGMLLLNGWPSWIVLPASAVGGAVAGTVTALLHTKLKISKLLSGILVMTMLYSLSLRTMGTSNLSLLNTSTLMGNLSENPNQALALAIIAIMTAAIGFGVWAFLKTQVGLRVRAAGDSDTVLEQRGFERGSLYLIALALANGLAAVGGVLISQYQGFVDVSMGIGLVINCLAAIIIGETMFRPERVSTLLAAPVVGMIIYQFVVAVALRLGLAAADLKVATALLALSFVALDRFRATAGRTSRQIGNRNV